MTSQQQRAELHRRIWQIANDVRGSVDGWDFKQYVLGALFIALSVSILQSFLMMNRPIIQHLAMTSSQTKSKMTPSKSKGFLFTQASYLPMSPKMPTITTI